MTRYKSNQIEPNHLALLNTLLMIRSNKNENHTIGTELRYNQYKTEMLRFPNRSKN